MSQFIPSTPIYLNAVASELPNRVVDNEAVVAWLGSKIRSSWIETRTGIRSRRWVEPSESCSDLAVRSAERSLSLLSKEERLKIRQVLLGTVSGDFISPPTSPLIQDRLDLQDCGALDFGAACAGFVSGLHLSSALVNSTRQDHLLICSEVRSKFISPEDFNTAVLFGDGASSGVISVHSGSGAFRVLGTRLGSDGSVFDLIGIPAGGSRNPFRPETDPRDAYLRMENGSAVFLKAVHAMTELPERLLRELGRKFEDLRWIVPHQANLLLIGEIEKRIPNASGKMVETISETGNTSGASVGIALAKLCKNPELRAGDLVLLTSAGGGGLAACALLEKC